MKFKTKAEHSRYDAIVVGGGHNWPGFAREGSTNINLDINAGEELWNFFSRHSLGDE